MPHGRGVEGITPSLAWECLQASTGVKGLIWHTTLTAISEIMAREMATLRQSYVQYNMCSTSLCCKYTYIFCEQYIHNVHLCQPQN